MNVCVCGWKALAASFFLLFFFFCDGKTWGLCSLGVLFQATSRRQLFCSLTIPLPFFSLPGSASRDVQFSFILHSLHGLPVRQTASGFNLRQVYYWRRMFSERLLYPPTTPRAPHALMCSIGLMKYYMLVFSIWRGDMRR